MESTTFQARVSSVTIKKGVVIQLEVSPEYYDEIPTLAKLGGQLVMVGVQSAQQQLDLDEE